MASLAAITKNSLRRSRSSPVTNSASGTCPSAGHSSALNPEDRPHAPLDQTHLHRTGRRRHAGDSVLVLRRLAGRSRITRGDGGTGRLGRTVALGGFGSGTIQVAAAGRYSRFDPA